MFHLETTPRVLLPSSRYASSPVLCLFNALPALGDAVVKELLFAPCHPCNPRAGVAYSFMWLGGHGGVQVPLLLGGLPGHLRGPKASCKLLAVTLFSNFSSGRPQVAEAACSMVAAVPVG